VGPGSSTLDLSLAKQFHVPFREKDALQFRAEAFNALNHPDWGAPNGNVQAGPAFTGAPANAAHQGFGVISSTAIAMRQLQVGLKYTF
jgi:hypothetical protein